MKGMVKVSTNIFIKLGKQLLKFMHENKCTGIAKKTVRRKAIWTAICKRMKRTTILHHTQKSTQT